MSDQLTVVVFFFRGCTVTVSVVSSSETCASSVVVLSNIAELSTGMVTAVSFLRWPSRPFCSWRRVVVRVCVVCVVGSVRGRGRMTWNTGFLARLGVGVDKSLAFLFMYTLPSLNMLPGFQTTISIT